MFPYRVVNATAGLRLGVNILCAAPTRKLGVGVSPVVERVAMKTAAVVVCRTRIHYIWMRRK
jgi:hypothetical protein